MKTIEYVKPSSKLVWCFRWAIEANKAKLNRRITAARGTN